MRASLLAACVFFASAAAAAPAAPDRDEMARLAFTNDLLQKRVSLAKGKDFYLLLDPSEESLALMFKAALLQAYRVQGLEVGVPRVMWHTRTEASGWEGKIWSKGNLDPARAIDRVEVQAPPPTREGTEMEVKIPQTPEEKYPVPSRYHIRFDGGLSIEVRPPGTEAKAGFWSRFTSRLGAWWADAKAASGDKDTVRLHVVLSKQDAESLYRALPPNTALLVVPPSP